MVKVKDEVKESIDLSGIKEELTDYIDIQLKKELNAELEKSNKRLIREKNKKIFWNNVIIIILLAIIIFLLYLLYKNNYFDKYLNNNAASNTVNVSKNVDEDDFIDKEKEPTLDELKEKYANLLDNYIISENSIYIKDYYSANLSNELMLYLTLNRINFDDLTIYEDYNVIDEDIIKKEYESLFEDKYISVSFDYNNNKVRFLKKLNSYITDNILKKEESNIKREIIDIKVKNDSVIISTVEGLIKDNKLYNIVSNKEINSYKKDNLVSYKDKLNTVIYTFKDGKLISLEK